jgi:hypothetical protein
VTPIEALDGGQVGWDAAVPASSWTDSKIVIARTLARGRCAIRVRPGAAFESKPARHPSQGVPPRWGRAD